MVLVFMVLVFMILVIMLLVFMPYMACPIMNMLTIRAALDRTKYGIYEKKIWIVFYFRRRCCEHIYKI